MKKIQKVWGLVYCTIKSNLWFWLSILLIFVLLNDLNNFKVHEEEKRIIYQERIELLNK